MIKHSERPPSLNSILDHHQNSDCYESWYSLHLELPQSNRKINNAPNQQSKIQRHSSCKKYEKFKGFTNKSDSLSQNNDPVFDFFGLANKPEEKRQNFHNAKEKKAIHNNSIQMLKNCQHQPVKKAEIGNGDNTRYQASFCGLNFHKENKQNTKLTKRSNILPKFVPKRETIKHTHRYLHLSRAKCPLVDTSNQISTKSMQKIGDETEKKSKLFETMFNIQIHEVTNDECKECKKNKEVKQKYRQVGQKLKILNQQLRQQVWALQKYLSQMRSNIANMFFYPIQKKEEKTTDSFCFSDLFLDPPTLPSNFQTQSSLMKEKQLLPSYQMHEQSLLQQNLDQTKKDIHNTAIGPYFKTKESKQSAVHSKQNKKTKDEQIETKLLDLFKKEAELKSTSCSESLVGKLKDHTNILNSRTI